MILNRMGQLHEAALRAAKDRALRQSEQATLKLDDMLIEGGFYSACEKFDRNSLKVASTPPSRSSCRTSRGSPTPC